MYGTRFDLTTSLLANQLNKHFSFGAKQERRGECLFLLIMHLCLYLYIAINVLICVLIFVIGYKIYAIKNRSANMSSAHRIEFIFIFDAIS